MKKSLSLAAIGLVALSSFLLGNLKVKNKSLAVIPSIVIGIPPMHLSAVYSEQEKITTNSFIFDYVKNNT